MPSTTRTRRAVLPALLLAASAAIAGCTAQDAAAPGGDAAQQAQERADALRAELTAFMLPGGEQSLEPSALAGAGDGSGFHAESLFGGRAGEGETIVGEAAAALRDAGLTAVTQLPDGSQVPSAPGALSTGYWTDGDWVVGAQAGIRLDENGAQSGDVLLQYLFLAVAPGAES
ncbi:hypothetical protein [Arenivirga flava]|uniref:Uncharacterized protein n=1 Tax=Arenivirga flava TaxID=1930060 RepID=A0AA37XAK6_9MICO|nr:hypothetical protein [Arenivirga flava]GMA27556.1 hypothetical protein GCM10025874_08090 [Arenivirga flava]